MRSSYAKLVRATLTAAERKLFSRLNSPKKIQDFLDTIAINFELAGETALSPRDVLKENRAHCFEGAVLAAAICAYHGRVPLLMDFATAYDDEDHTVALFKERGLWGAISKTNHSVLRYRDAVYRSIRELTMSYFHEYFLWDGRKSLRAFSKPFNLSRFQPQTWVTSNTGVDWIMKLLANSQYYTVMASARALRKASEIELKALALTEWKDPHKKQRSRGIPSG